MCTRGASRSSWAPCSRTPRRTLRACQGSRAPTHRLWRGRKRGWRAHCARHCAVAAVADRAAGVPRTRRAYAPAFGDFRCAPEALGPAAPASPCPAQHAHATSSTSIRSTSSSSDDMTSSARNRGSSDAEEPGRRRMGGRARATSKVSRYSAGLQPEACALISEMATGDRARADVSHHYSCARQQWQMFI